MNFFLLTTLIVLSNAAHASCGKQMKVGHLVRPTAKTGGPTSLAMAMNYYGKKYTGKDVCTYLGNCNRSTGSDFDELLAAAKHYGFKQAAWKTGISELQNAIAKNVTAVAIINIKAKSYPKLTNGTAPHTDYTGGAYIEIHGIHCDSKGNIDYYIVNDPAKKGWKDLKITAASMKTAWGARDYKFLALKSYSSSSSDSSSNNNNNNGGTKPSSSTCTKKMVVAHQKQPTSYSCGPTSLAMAMNYSGKKLTGKQVCSWIGNCYRTSGTGYEEMVAAAKHYGFSKTAWKFGIAQYKKAIAAGVTTVAILDIIAGRYPKKTDGSAAFTSYSGGHYIEMHGYHCDSKGNIDYYYCNDPGSSSGKNRQYTYSSMKTAWGGRGYRFLALKSY